MNLDPAWLSRCGDLLEQSAQRRPPWLLGEREGRAAGCSLSLIRAKTSGVYSIAELGLPRRNTNSTRVEALKGRLDGRYSVRINDQWRVVFEWTTEGPSRVRVTDYH
jgi:toxin HigB-1